MKVPKMMVHYTLLFTVPTAIALCFWNPKSDDDIRAAVEAKVKPDAERRRKHQAKFAELLLQHPSDPSSISRESKQQLNDVTRFTKRP